MTGPGCTASPSSATPFPVLDLKVVTGDEMRVVGTNRDLGEPAHLVAPFVLTDARDVNDQPDGTARQNGRYRRARTGQRRRSGQLETRCTIRYSVCAFKPGY